MDAHDPAAKPRDTAYESAKRILHRQRIDFSPSDALKQVVKRLFRQIL
jgi:hypothetical protein